MMCEEKSEFSAEANGKGSCIRLIFKTTNTFSFQQIAIYIA